VAEELERLCAEVADAGCRFYALAARALNRTIDLAHNHRLTRQQTIMFALADMMTYVEVGAALARKAVKLTHAKAADAEKYRAMARVFAGEVTQLVGENALKIATSGDLEAAAAQQHLAEIDYTEMLAGRANWAKDLDRIADIIFER
jgi:alkylation response protein AidB-like acyl-CoA dehydrogenase